MKGPTAEDERRGERAVPVRWSADGEGIVILDQTELPGRRVERELRDVAEVEEAIRALRVRGAPLIGIVAAMGVAACAARERSRQIRIRGEASPAQLAPSDEATERDFTTSVLQWCDRLERARPTAVNLAWALGRMRRAAREAEPGEPEELTARLRREADRIRLEDREMCRRIGEHALELIRDGSAVLTHCNTGVLATGGIGTALAPIYLAVERGWQVRVFADETRPLLQGSRLTAWELGEAGVDVTVIGDGMAGTLMARDRPEAVLVGADRIAANGDVANKVGTYGLAVLARHHGVPFYVLAPTSTVDLATPTGAEIPIEERSADEVRRGFGVLTAPADARVWSPAFDVTPAELVSGIVTERGISRPPYAESLARAVEEAEEERRAAHGAKPERAGEATAPGTR